MVSGSHDAIGSSISQALAFTNAMTLPANNQDNIPTTETQQIQQNVLSTPQNELQTQRLFCYSSFECFFKLKVSKI